MYKWFPALLAATLVLSEMSRHSFRGALFVSAGFAVLFWLLHTR